MVRMVLVSLEKVKPKWREIFSEIRFKIEQFQENPPTKPSAGSV